MFPSSTRPEIRRFHVVVQRLLRNVQKSVMHLQSCCFANPNLFLFFFCRSRCPRRCRCLSSQLIFKPESVYLWAFLAFNISFFKMILYADGRLIHFTADELLLAEDDGRPTLIWIVLLIGSKFAPFCGKTVGRVAKCLCLPLKRLPYKLPVSFNYINPATSFQYLS